MSVAKKNLKAALFLAQKNAELQAEVRALQKDIMQAALAADEGREEIKKLRDLIDFYQACGFVVFENTEDDGRVSKFVGHAGAEHYPPRPV